ncbi:MAG TPA: SulP family inorganic anion transporter [Planctomycetia bacterium]|nr:SulP family inorganic anion transporter [Planctomycetia bacterium]
MSALADNGPVPDSSLAGQRTNSRFDAASGFLVFLIALPLCLAIAKASGFPPIAGIFTAVVGGLITPWLSNSQLTIKGPAAGLIVIVLGAVTEFRQEFGGELLTERQAVAAELANNKDDSASADKLRRIDNQLDRQAYRLALGVGVAAAALQILFGLCRGGMLGDFFPVSAVHGLLASIGIIIISKQIHAVFGVVPQSSEPLHLLGEIPATLGRANWEISTIGLASLLILFGLPLFKSRFVRRIPAPMLVLLLAVPVGLWFDLDHEHVVKYLGHEEAVGPRFLVDIPNKLAEGIAFPDFRGLATATGAKWVIMFMLIGTLESMLSAKAVDLLDPWRRKTDLNRDVLATGAANLVSAAIGGLPMISEIVRSSANVNNGARTRFANMYHGIFLLAFVALLPGLIHEIPLAALAAMLCYTGYRLASPKEFFNVYRVGKEQLVIFVATIVATLATDLLIGIACGIAVKWIIHWANGMALADIFRPSVVMATRDDGVHVVAVRNAVVFSNWIAFRGKLAALEDADVVLDLSEARLVDHTVMEKLHELEVEFRGVGRTLEIVGLDNHRPLSKHPLAARKRVLSGAAS